MTSSTKSNPVMFNEGDRVIIKTHYQSSAEEHTILNFFYFMKVIGDEFGKVIAKQNESESGTV